MIQSAPRLIAPLLGLLALNSAPPAQTLKPPAELSEVLAQVRLALIDTQKQLEEQAVPPLESVTLTLQATQSTKADGKLRLWILTIGAARERELSQSFVLVLKPPSKTEKRAVSATPSLYDALVKAIVAAAVDVQATRILEPKLSLTRVETEITFSITRDKDGGISLSPVGFDADAGTKSTVAHKIAIAFEKPTPK